MASYRLLFIYVLSCITISLTSCSKEESLNRDNNIEFSTKVNPTYSSPNTKGTPITSIYSINNFGIVAHYNNTQGGSSTNFMNNINVHKVNSSFEYSPKLTWPESGTVSFYGYAPYSTNYNGININTTNGVAELEYSVPTNVIYQPDIMITTPMLNRDSNDDIVNLSFNHALTAIKFKAQGDGCEITKIAFKNIYTKGKTDLIKGDLVWYDLKKTSNEYLSGIKDGSFTTTAESQTAINSNGYLMMIPQTIPEGGTIVTIVDGIERSIDISGDKWETGQIVTYSYTPQDYWRLEDFSSTNYPTSDNWVIVDEYEVSAFSEDDYAGLRNAIVAVSNNSDREITIKFPYLTKLAVKAIGSVYNASDYSCLKGIELPEATDILDYSLSYCKSLESIDAPNVTHIGTYAFASSKISNINMPNIERLDARAFIDCKDLNSIELNNIKTIEIECFKGCSGLLSVTAPNVTEVKNNAFSECSALTTVNLPKLKSIGASAFYSCKALKDINLSNVESMEEDVFKYCSGLESVELEKLTTSGNSAFLSCSKLINVNLPLLTSVSTSMFSGCSSLTNIYLPKVESIQMEGFKNCSNLSNAEFPNTNYVNYSAFMGCKKLLTLEFATNSGKLLTYLTYNSFYFCNTANITLTINGVGSSLKIDNNSLLNSSNSSILYTFKEIVIN